MSPLKEGWRGFLTLCLEIKDPHMLEAFFDLQLTPEEKDNFATRILIIRELLKGEKTQREMAKELQVSIAKITRGSNALKRLDKRLLDFLRTKMLE